jgi:tRNA(Ile)-lysidine synthase
MVTDDLFLHYLHRCGYTQGEPVLATSSGGLDSMVLCELLRKNRIPFAIAHVNFGLRGEESMQDEQFIADYAAKIDVPFYLDRASEKHFAATGESSVQAAARKIRYQFFELTAVAQGFLHIAVAHHADDNIETALLNFARGSGAAGLTGMESRNGKVIRPLLQFRRADILEYAQLHHLSWREDSSNASDKYSRNRFRHHLLPWLLQEIPQGYEGFSATFRNLRETEALVEAALVNWEKMCCSISGNGIEISIEAMRSFGRPEIFLRFFLSRSAFNESASSLHAFLQSESGTQLLSATHRLVRDRKTLFLVPLEGRDPAFTLVVSRERFTGDIPDGRCTALVDADTIHQPLQLRPWQHGDKLIPFGMDGHRKVSDILNDLKLPLHEKEIAQLVVSGEEIVWIPGYRIAEKFRVRESTTDVLRITVENKRIE